MKSVLNALLKHLCCEVVRRLHVWLLHACHSFDWESEFQFGGLLKSGNFNVSFGDVEVWELTKVLSVPC